MAEGAQFHSVACADLDLVQLWANQTYRRKHLPLITEALVFSGLILDQNI